MNLLAQKGLDAGDTETSAQLVELLKSNPDFLRGFLSSAPEAQDTSSATGMGMGMGELGNMQFPGSSSTTYSEEMEGLSSGIEIGDLMANGLQYENLLDDGMAFLDPSLELSSIPMDVQVDTSIETSLEAASSPSPLPKVEVKTEFEPILTPSQPIPPPPAALPIPTIPAPVFMPPTLVVSKPRPAADRIQAFGFPPMMGQR